MLFECIAIEFGCARKLLAIPKPALVLPKRIVYAVRVALVFALRPVGVILGRVGIARAEKLSTVTFAEPNAVRLRWGGVPIRATDQRHPRDPRREQRRSRGVSGHTPCLSGSRARRKCLSVLKCEPAEGGRAAVAVGSRRVNTTAGNDTQREEAGMMRGDKTDIAEASG